MPDSQRPFTAKQTFGLILVPMVLTFLCQRGYLHWAGVRHVYAGGYLIHHLFMGVLLVMAAAFVLAFAPRRPMVAGPARVLLGSGSAMVLDEIVYLVMTKGSDQDYVSALSLHGAIVCMAAGIILLTAVYWLNRDS